MGDWLQGRKPNDYVFTNSHGQPLTRWGADYQMKRYARWTGVPQHKRHCHVLKHTAGVLMRKSGATLEQIQARLGHKRLDSTAQHLRVTQDEVDEAAARAFGAVAS
jgi:site-specific recombinase XerD